MDKKDKSAIEKRISEIEQLMLQNDFWQNKDLAQKTLRELDDLKNSLAGREKHDKNNAIINIFAGVGGEDAEDWTRMLLEMYMKFVGRRQWQINFLDENKNDNGGFRSATFEIIGKNVYGTLKSESGVHRLVRKSPFNSAGKRQTSFALVEVLPEFADDDGLKIKDDELEISYTKSSGPGGQNVNKRETAVRIVHKPTGLSAFVSNERSQAQNKEKALELICGKIYKLLEEQKKDDIAELSVSKNTEASWGSQIRSYVLHPYKMVKDHRTKTETSDVEAVLGGGIDLFIEAMKK
ncbi:MAG TPA: PCRF domain-containing protein [Candidatus Paceibacterota bacterium]|nr:PCRF domain-containing protein [Candidatus Paceibacterota bacterium]HRZ34669.1 PCRF domain-containing protein [Candidatus Paceibacterota bacterium]